MLLMFLSVSSKANTQFKDLKPAQNWCQKNPEKTQKMMDDLKRDHLCSLGSLQDCEKISGVGMAVGAAVAGATAAGAYYMRRTPRGVPNVCGFGSLDFHKQNLFAFGSVAWAANCREPRLMMAGQMENLFNDQLTHLDEMENAITQNYRDNKPQVAEAFERRILTLRDQVESALTDPKGGAVSRIADTEKEKFRRVFRVMPSMDDGYISSAVQYEKYMQHMEQNLKEVFPTQWAEFETELNKEKAIKNLQAGRENKKKIALLKEQIAAQSKKLAKMRGSSTTTMAQLRDLFQATPSFQSSNPSLNQRVSSFDIQLDYWDQSTPGGIGPKIRDVHLSNQAQKGKTLRRAGKQLVKFVPLLGPAVAMANPMETIHDNLMFFSTTSNLGCGQTTSAWETIDENCQPVYEWNERAISFYTMPRDIQQNEMRSHSHYFCELTRKLHAERGAKRWRASCEPRPVIHSRRGEGRYEVSVGPNGRPIRLTYFPAKGVAGSHQVVLDAEGTIQEVRMMPQSRHSRRKKRKAKTPDMLFSSPRYYSRMTGPYLRTTSPGSSNSAFYKSNAFVQANYAMITDVAACCQGNYSPSECRLYGIKSKGMSTVTPIGTTPGVGDR